MKTLTREIMMEKIRMILKADLLPEEEWLASLFIKFAEELIGENFNAPEDSALWYMDQFKEELRAKLEALKGKRK